MPDVIRQRLQQFDVVARKKLAGLRAADAEEGDGAAAHRAGQIVVEIEIGDGLPHGSGPASGDGVQMIAGALEEDVGRALRPVEEAQIERAGECSGPRARTQRSCAAAIGDSAVGVAPPSWSARKKATCRIESVCISRSATDCSMWSRSVSEFSSRANSISVRR